MYCMQIQECATLACFQEELKEQKMYDGVERNLDEIKFVWGGGGGGSDKIARVKEQKREGE